MELVECAERRLRVEIPSRESSAQIWLAKDFRHPVAEDLDVLLSDEESCSCQSTAGGERMAVQEIDA